MTDKRRVPIFVSPGDRAMAALTGGIRRGGVTLTRGQMASLRRCYGFEQTKPLDAEEEFLQAGTDRNALRLAEMDGLRVMAFIARFIDKQEDPVEFLQALLNEAGCDVPFPGDEWEEFKASGERIDWTPKGEDDE